MANRIKHQTQNIIIPAGAPAGTSLEFRVTMDNAYKKATGYVAYENQAPGAPYQIGIRDDNFVYQYLTAAEDYISARNVNKSDRYTKCDIPSAGNYVTVTVKTLAVNPTALNLDVVFQLSND